MPIPPFEADGHLPAGIHSATESDVRNDLVDAFPSSSTRPGIHQGWRLHRDAFRSIVPIDRQWIGGSFTTDKLDPGDIDLCSFVEGSDVDALPLDQQALVRFMAAGPITQAYWNCDSYLIARYPQSSAGHQQYRAALAYWSDHWGHTRADPATGERLMRGFLEVT